MPKKSTKRLRRLSRFSARLRHHWAKLSLKNRQAENWGKPEEKSKPKKRFVWAKTK